MTIAANFRRHADALALQLPLPFGTVLRWATRKPTTVLMRAIRAARGATFKALGRIKRPTARTVPGWAREAVRRAKALAKAQAEQQAEWFQERELPKARGRLSRMSRLIYVYADGTQSKVYG